jgi:hypothetical protein
MYFFFAFGSGSYSDSWRLRWYALASGRANAQTLRSNRPEE